jgi:hypothetical protein
MLSYRFFAKAYGWTPEQVDSLPEPAYEWLPKVEQAHSRVAEMKQKAAAREAGGKQRRGF